MMGGDSNIKSRSSMDSEKYSEEKEEKKREGERHRECRTSNREKSARVMKSPLKIKFQMKWNKSNKRPTYFHNEKIKRNVFQCKENVIIEVREKPFNVLRIVVNSLSLEMNFHFYFSVLIKNT